MREERRRRDNEVAAAPISQHRTAPATELLGVSGEQEQVGAGARDQRQRGGHRPGACWRSHAAEVCFRPESALCETVLRGPDLPSESIRGGPIAIHSR